MAAEVNYRSCKPTGYIASYWERVTCYRECHVIFCRVTILSFFLNKHPLSCQTKSHSQVGSTSSLSHYCMALCMALILLLCQGSTGCLWSLSNNNILFRGSLPVVMAYTCLKDGGVYFDHYIIKVIVVPFTRASGIFLQIWHRCMCLS